MSIVCKFGGTSIKDARHIENVLDIVTAHISEGAIMVASAINKTTDSIVRILRHAGRGSLSEAQQIISELEEQHHIIATHISSSKFWEDCLAHIGNHLTSLRDCVTTFSEMKSAHVETRKKTEAHIMAHGELLSNVLVYGFARARGHKVTLIDSRDLIVTDSHYLAATPNLSITLSRIKEKVRPESGHLYIIPGYISSNSAGETTTLGRGGSDYTAALIGAAVDATAVEIWTDVDGIMTTDPRMVANARTVPSISYPEAAELAYFGARVIHPSTILPAIQKRIPIAVRNSSDPHSAGTTIQPEERDAQGVCAIATKSNITIITMQSDRMLNAYGFLSRIFAVFEQHKIPVDIVTTSEVSVSVTVESHYDFDPLQSELEQFCNVEISTNYAIICLVGQNLWGDSFTIARTFRVLQHIPVRLVSLGSSDTNLTLVVERTNTQQAVRLLHREYFEHPH